MRTLITGMAAALLLSIAFVTPNEAAATTFREMTTEERIDLADLIVRGRVAEVWTERDERGRIWTRAQVEIDHVLKGDPDLDAIIVDQMGGEWSGYQAIVDGAARFDQGEDVLLMLARLPNGRIVTSGMFQGKYTIRIDPYSRTEIVQRFAPPQSRPYDHRFIPLPAEGERLKLADFEQRILERVYNPPARTGAAQGTTPAPAEVK